MRLGLATERSIMCLAIPGRIKDISGDDPIMRAGRVDFGGIVKEINLAYVPEARVGDYVLVHVGFALTVIDEAEAERVFEQLSEIADIEAAQREAVL
jgi:hydrogenase expression/formation protein HypC